MSTATLTLAEFLLARIAEDEAGVGDQPAFLHALTWGPEWDPEAGSVVVSVGRVLAECEAKRRIVKLCASVIEDDEGHSYYSDGWSGLSVARSTLRAFALPYADHPGYHEEWRP